MESSILQLEKLYFAFLLFVSICLFYCFIVSSLQKGKNVASWADLKVFGKREYLES